MATLEQWRDANRKLDMSAHGIVGAARCLFAKVPEKELREWGLQLLADHDQLRKCSDDLLELEKSERAV